MSQLHRFYVPDLAAQPARVTLPDDERHHALHVVRVRAGQRVQLFDGAGRWCDAEVVEAGRRELAIERQAIREEPASEPHLILAQAWLNHDKHMQTIVEQATALGVDAFVFFRGTHSERAPRGMEKWARWAIESCKQCGRNRLPEFSNVDDAGAIVLPDGWKLLVATQHLEAVPLDEAVAPGSRAMLAVGPEGDFSIHELEILSAKGATPISLGPLTLRSELAAVVAVSLVQYRLGPE